MKDSIILRLIRNDKEYNPVLYLKKVLWFLYQPYKWLVYIPFLGISTLFFGSLVVILLSVVNPRLASLIGGVTWARMNAFFAPMFVKKTGEENIDKNQSYVIVSNHQSQFDIFVLYGWMGVDFKWIMKQELRKVPALGIACERLGHVFIDRTNRESAIASLHAVKKRITKGTSIIFFPEGTRSKDGNIGEFKKGAFRMALELGFPVLPITIIGTNEILPPNTMDLFPGKAKMIIHKPIDSSAYNNETIEELMNRVKGVMQSGFEEVW